MFIKCKKKKNLQLPGHMFGISFEVLCVCVYMWVYVCVGCVGVCVCVYKSAFKYQDSVSYLHVSHSKAIRTFW